jgi:ABC-type amino acid transport substrate-binding protein
MSKRKIVGAWMVAMCVALAAGRAACAQDPAQAQAPTPLAAQQKGKIRVPAVQDNPPRSIRVGAFADAPFAMKDANGEWGGYSVLILDQAAVHAHLLLEFHEYHTLDELYRAIAAGDIDVGVGNTLVTSKRLAQIDFTQPTLDGGLRVMVSSDRTHTLGRLWQGMVSDGHVKIVMWGTVITLVLTVLVLAVLRRLDREFTKHWHEGFAESLYHVVSVAITGKTSYKGNLAPAWVGRLVASLWMVFGVATVAYVTSSLTSVMTANTITNRISGPQDLGGNTVAVLKGSVGERYCAEHHLDTLPFETVEEAAQAVAAKTADAAVADSQSLEYFDTSHPDVPVTEVGELFDRRHFAFPIRRGDDDLRRRIDIAVVSMRETGTLDKIREHFFGH